METADNWLAGHKSISWGNTVFLDSDAAQSDNAAYWNDTDPTSTVFTISTSGKVNDPGKGMVAYCWHPVEGYSKFGSYTGNGNADGPFI